MEWVIDKSFMPEYLRLLVTGNPTADDYVRLWEEVISSNEWRPGTPILKDITGRESLGVNAHAIQTAVADFLSRHRDLIGRSNIAIYTSYDIFNHIRILEYALRLRGSQMIIRIFDSEKAAVHWLTTAAGIHTEIIKPPSPSSI